MRSVEGAPHACDICGRRFLAIIALDVHREVDHAVYGVLAGPARCLGERPHHPHGGQEGDVEWSCPGVHDLTDPICWQRLVGERENEFAACPVCRDDGIPRDPSQTSAAVDALPANRAASPTAPSRADKIAAAIVPDQLDQYLPASETKGGKSSVEVFDKRTGDC